MPSSNEVPWRASSAEPEDMARISYMEAAIEFEERLARYLLTEMHDEINEEFGKMTKLVWDRTSDQGQEIWSILGTLDGGKAGAVGQGREALEQVARHGNLRERAGFLFRASLPQKIENTGQEVKILQNVVGTQKKQHPALKKERNDRINTEAYRVYEEASQAVKSGDVEAIAAAQAAKERLRGNYKASEVRPPLSEAEKKFAGNGENLPWIPARNKKGFLMNTKIQWEAQDTQALVATGTSGTAYWLTLAAREMNKKYMSQIGSEIDISLIRLGIFATMSANGHHTLDETFRGTSLAIEEINSTEENDSTGTLYRELIYSGDRERYKYVYPLGEELLRREITPNGFFPHELADKEKENRQAPIEEDSFERIATVANMRSTGVDDKQAQGTSESEGNFQDTVLVGRIPQLSEKVQSRRLK